MGTALTGSSVASTYDALLKITDNGPVGGSLKTVTDGLGNDSALQVSSAGIKSTGTLAVDGASTLAAVSATSVTSSGAVSGTTGTFSGTLTPQALVDISGASAGQIKFPASQNASANANTLDDYEEGTWTPSLGGTATYTVQFGRYTKIGRLVLLNGRLAVNSIGTGSTGVISGLPFASATTAAGSIGYFQEIATAGYSALYCYANGTDLNFAAQVNNAIGVNNPGTIFKNSTDIIFSVSYYV